MSHFCLKKEAKLSESKSGNVEHALRFGHLVPFQQVSQFAQSRQREMIATTLTSTELAKARDQGRRQAYEEAMKNDYIPIDRLRRDEFS